MRLATSAPKLCLRSAAAFLTSTCWAIDLQYRSFGLGPKAAVMIRTSLHHMSLFPGQIAFQAGDSDSRAAFIRSNRTSRASLFHCTEMAGHRNGQYLGAQRTLYRSPSLRIVPGAFALAR